MKQAKRCVVEKKDITKRLNAFLNYLNKEKMIQKGSIAKKLGMSHQQLIHYSKGVLDAFNIGDKLEQEFGLNLSWYILGEGDMIKSNSKNEHVNINDLFKIKIYDIPAHALIGTSGGLDDMPFTTSELQLGVRLNPDTVKGIRISGDSMKDSGIFNGSVVLYDTALNPVNHCDIVANHNGVLICKHYELVEDRPVLYSKYNGDKIVYPIGEQDFFKTLGVVRFVLQYR